MLSRSEIESLIPHKGAMCLWDEVVDWDSRHIRLLASNHRDPSHPLRSHDRLHAVHLCEYGAQAMAVHGGLKGAPRAGMLVAVRDLKLQVARIDDVEGEILVEARRLAANPNGLIYSFSARAGTGELGSGRVSVMWPKLQPR